MNTKTPTVRVWRSVQRPFVAIIHHDHFEAGQPIDHPGLIHVNDTTGQMFIAEQGKAVRVQIMVVP